jgi:hypothetical protein
VSLTALSLTALPAATGLARQAAHSGAAVGQGFLNMLSERPAPLANPSDAEGAGKSDAPSNAAGSTLPPSAAAAKTQSWCEKFMNWLGQQRPSADLKLKLSLDNLDQPHVEVEGENAESLEAAIAQDPIWLQEFRELALDRTVERGSSAPLTLKIERRSGQIDSQWLPN